ncbi:MAG: NUDIX domain-containing protein [Patescibacteria group bacterium]|jgi:hypothetical protein
MKRFLLFLLRPIASPIFSLLQKYQSTHHRLPEWYFFALERTVPIPAFELLVTKKTNEGEQIFLIKRPADDPTWPSLWHFPGTIQRYFDTFEDIEKRWAEELGLRSLPQKPKLLTIRFDEDRGRHAHLLHHLEVSAETEFPTGSFFPVDDLPNDMITFEKRQLQEIL